MSELPEREVREALVLEHEGAPHMQGGHVDEDTEASGEDSGHGGNGVHSQRTTVVPAVRRWSEISQDTHP